MSILSRFVAILLLIPIAAGAVCIKSDLATDANSADFVAVVTVMSSSIENDERLEHAKYFSIVHKFAVVSVLKGTSRVSRIVTRERYHDPRKRAFQHSESVRIHPGDSVLLMSSSEDLSVEVSLCSASRVIDENSSVVGDAEKALRSGNSN